MTKFNKDKYLRKMRLKRYNKYFYLGLPCLLVLILGLYFAYSKFSVSKDTEVVRTTVGDFIYGDIVIGAYINGEYSSTFPGKNDGYKLEKVECNNNSIAEWNNDSWGLAVSNLNERTKCNVYFISDISVNFDYTGGEQTFTTPVSGTYKLETWGAQGGSYNEKIGTGGYSVGYIKLAKDNDLYINVGGMGNTTSTSIVEGGYNGGGKAGYQSGFENTRYFSSGGGATHIALKSGLLSSLENDKNSILIVSGGGGGSYYGTGDDNKGGDGGGYIGNNGEQTTIGWGSFGYGGTQTSGGRPICDSATCSSGGTAVPTMVGTFGQGGYAGNFSTGGGGGFYGGGASIHVQSAGGGSGYIGNSLLTSKVMYCYNCSESSDDNTKTISTTCTSENPTENCAKKGNGYARITLVSVSE